VFEGAATQREAVDCATRELLAELCATLRARESGATRLDLEMKRADLPRARYVVSMSYPTRDAKHIWSLIQPRLENLNLGFGVEEIAITASRSARVPHEQREHWREGTAAVTDAATEQALGTLLDTLANRLGREAVQRAEPVESHIPERAFRVSSVMSAKGRGSSRVGDAASSVHVRRAFDRPTVLFDRPQHVEVTSCSPNGAVLGVRWRGEAYRIVQSIGPERLAPEWWRASSPSETRDYFKAQTETGRWIWLYREWSTNRWFIHGAWA